MSEPTRIAALCDRYLKHRLALAALGIVTDRGGEDNCPRYIHSFLEHVGDVDPASLRNSDLLQWLAANPRWKSPHTLCDAVATVIACFRWLFDEELLDRVRFNKRTLRLPVQRPRQPILESEYLAMMKFARNGRVGRANRGGGGYRKSRIALRVAMHFLWTTGARPCEMRELKWSDVDLDRGVCVLTEHKTERTGRDRIIALPESVVRLFRLFQRRGRTTGHVFLNGRGRPWVRERFACIFRRYAWRAGLRKGITAYCLRHGFCCRGLEAGVGERQLADLMGHTTTRYVSWYGSGVRKRLNYLHNSLDLVNGTTPKNPPPKPERVKPRAVPPAKYLDRVQIAILRTLASAKRPMIAAEIVEAAGIPRDTIFHLGRMRKLRDLGLIENNRMAGSIITEAGRAALKHHEGMS
jgi:integrase